MRTNIFITGIILLILISNAFYASYPDEFDNILGGKLILQGIIPYKGFFSHHGPISYFIAAIVNLLSGISFVNFRVVLAIFYFVLFVITFKVLKKYLSPIFFVGLAVAMPFFWGQMLLADTLSALFLLPAYGLFLYKSYHGEKMERKDLWIISIFSSLTVLNSPTYLYAVSFLILFTYFYLVKDILRNTKYIIHNTLYFILSFSLPYLIFGLYLLLTGSISDFIYQEINYNKSYYIYNYPRPEGSTTFNPIRYMTVIFNNFVNQYQPLLAGLKGTDFRFPITAALAVTNTILWIYLLIKRKFMLCTASFLLIVYINARGNIGDVRATDYQMAVYFVLTLFNAFFLFGVKDKIVKPLFYILGFFLFFAGLFLLSDFWRLNYTRYMGEAPLIYDRPVVAPIFNKLFTKSDYCWVGPFEFEEMYYSKCKFPSKYHWILPQFGGIEKIKTEILTDYANKKPDIIVFRRDYSAFGQSSAFNEFFVRFLDENYTRLKGYKFKDPKQKDFNFNDDFNFRKEIASIYFQKLFDLGYLDISK